MKILNKLVLFYLVFFTSLSAESFYIKEPILNTTVYIEEYGKKENEALVFVHGLGNEASSIWKDSIKLLENKYHIITFDLPGFGKSSKENKKYTPTNYALIMNHILSKYIKKPFTLIGHSMGGAICIKYTSIYNKKVKRLLLIDVAGILHQDSYSNFLLNTSINKYINKVPVLEKPISNFFSKLTSKVQNLIPSDLNFILDSENLRNIIFKANPSTISAVGLLMEDYTSSINNINIPTTILWGEEDNIAPIRTGYVLNKLIKDSELITIKNSKHVPMIDSKNMYEKYLKDFLSGKKQKNNILSKNTYFKDLIIENQSDVKVEGIVNNLIISNCTNITIVNSQITNINIINSSVDIINTKIKSKTNSLFVQNSKLNITASDIIGRNAVIIINSKIDIAGSFVKGKEFSFINSSNTKNSTLIFSLTSIESSLMKNKILHENMKFLKENKL